MFKTLIKKVREESSNPSILPENNTEEINNHVTNDNNNNLDEENSSTTRTHRRSISSTHQSSINNSRLSSTSHEPEKKEESITSLAEIFSPYIEEPISTNNYVQTLKAWIDSKEEVLQLKDENIQRLTEETNHLQNEMILVKNKLTDLHSRRNSTTDSVTKTSHLQKQIDTLRSDNENLKLSMKSLRTQLNDVEAERDDLLIKSTDVSNLKSSDDLQKQLDKQKAENEQQKLELVKLRQMLIERDAIIEEQDRRLLFDRETQGIQTDEDTSFVQVLAEPDVDTISKLQAELDEKNRTIKNLQQRYNDLRKTLQREFHASIPKDLNQMGSSKTSSNTPSSPSTNIPMIHYDAAATSQSDVDAAKRASTARQMTAVRKNVSFTTNTSTVAAAAAPTSPAILPHTSIESTSTKPQKNGHRSSISDGQNTINGTNFKYLKHVLLKFMTATEDEAIHLIRAVSTLLNFSADEERLIRETLDYKMSWFGKVSRIKPLSSNTNF